MELNQSDFTLGARLRQAYREKRLGPAVSLRLRPYLQGLAYLVRNPAAGIVRLHCPAYQQPGSEGAERDLAARILRAYQRMKVDQEKASPLYGPSSLWEAQLNKAYAHLISGGRAGDLDKFHFFLANFGVWEEYTGVEECTLIRQYMGLALTRRYLENAIFLNLYRLWLHYYGGRKSPQALGRPSHGNLAGAVIDGVLVTVDSFFGEIYGSLLGGLVRGRPRPVVAELGGGCGRLAYYLVRDLPGCTYLDFDLPETLCLAAYYLMLAFPEKRTLLYGEGEFSPACHGDYDFIFMPAYEIDKLGSQTVDLFINETSLGEMTAGAIANYLRYITEASRYFFHVNRERVRNVFQGGEASLLGYEYPVPAAEFTLLFRYPELKHLLYYGGKADLRSDAFIYLYEKNSWGSGGQGE